MKIKQTRLYEAPQTELVEISPIAVLCESSAASATDGSLFQFEIGTTGQWD